MQHHRVKYHENVLEELGQRTNINVQLAQTVKNIEKNLIKESENASKQANQTENKE